MSWILRNIWLTKLSIFPEIFIFFFPAPVVSVLHITQRDHKDDIICDHASVILYDVIVQNNLLCFKIGNSNFWNEYDSEEKNLYFMSGEPLYLQTSIERQLCRQTM